MPSHQLSRSGWIYFSAVVALGLATVARSIHTVVADSPVDPALDWLVLAALTLVSSSATVKLPSLPATISVSEAFLFVVTLLYGPAAGTLTVALDALVIGFWSRRKGNPLHKIVFTVSANPLAMWIGAQLFFAMTGIVPLSRADRATISVAALILPLLLFTLIYFGVSSWLIAIAIAFEKKLSASRVWRRDLAWLSLNYVGGASVALLLVGYTPLREPAALVVIVPFLVVLYLAFVTSMGRVEDASRHLSQLNALYLSTIETLAMAIDAKDQITHGHIRRVQQRAVRLAGELGVTDDSQIRAIAAAALLHDMGKLAVPDYILNKPGLLTPAEYEKIKLHSSVGADILSSIEFPYPVVPIVRHHHENWDGSGYPDGLQGMDIPVGARILSVVDCFDALTSDRPYRPRLSDGAALEVILRGRGSMYDPVVVDAFVRVHGEQTETTTAVATTPRAAFSAITEAALPPSATSKPQSERLEDISASSEEMLTLFEISRSLGGSLGIDDAAGVIAQHLRRLVPSTFSVFYLYEPPSDELAVAHAAGDTKGVFTGLRIPLGQRLTGWVAANRQTIVNSDPMLDLGDTARALQPPLRSSISTPLVTGDALVGVLTLYSSNRSAFTDDHRRILEAIARQVSHVLRSARDFDRGRAPAMRDSLTGLPNVERLRQFAASVTNAEGKLDGPCSVLFIDVDGLKDVNRQHGRAAGDKILAGVVHATRRTLRGADLLFRYRSDEFVVFLAQTDPHTARSIASRLEAAIRDTTFGPPSRGVTVSVTTGVASAPGDGFSFDDVVNQARLRAREKSPGGIQEPPSSVH